MSPINRRPMSSADRIVSGCLFMVIQLRAHTQQGSGESSSKGDDRRCEARFWEVKRNYSTISRKHGGRKRRVGLAEATNELTNVNYILEKCSYRTVYPIFVDVDPAFNYQDCDYRHFACIEQHLGNSASPVQSPCHNSASTFLCLHTCTDTELIAWLYDDT